MATRTDSIWLVGVALLLSLAILWGATPVASQGSAGPASSWAFNEGSGQTLGDSSGSRNGTIVGATWTVGKYGQALDFAGDAVVDLGDLGHTGSFTVMAWMQTRSLATGDCRSLVMKVYDYGFEICDGGLYAGVGNGTAFTAYVSTPLTTVDLDVWKHVALTYDGTTLRFYVNGTLVASAPGVHVSTSYSTSGCSAPSRSRPTWRRRFPPGMLRLRTFETTWSCRG